MIYKRLSQNQDVTSKDIDVAYGHKEHNGLGMYEQSGLVLRLMREDGADHYDVFTDVLNEYFLRHPDLHTAWRAISLAKRKVVCHDLFYGLVQEMKDEAERQDAAAEVERVARLSGLSVDEYRALDKPDQLLAQIRAKGANFGNEKTERERQAAMQSDVQDVFKDYDVSIDTAKEPATFDTPALNGADLVLVDGDTVVYEEYPIHRAIENLAEKSKRDDYDDAMKVVE